MGVTNRMTCEEAVRQFFAYLDRELTGDTLEALEAHLETCLDCCDRLQFGRRFDAFIKRRLNRAAVPKQLEVEIRRAIRRRTEPQSKA